ncbi:DSD1 family PLP-dependent enzyme [uncultured Pseudoteredinibacter sp.]|uniref:DSD1 family PLP-dependent enzyme n=1 Tax=uncultured Pseudoteredinibacter sp. TaxID=1641701 RepID=UPI002629AA63|nr:DSD1 family PLP-dependent enzyme [uncultured Pseudoteredinibacter sp.]
MQKTKRNMLLGLGAAGIAAAALKPRDNGGAHSDYFKALSHNLAEADVSQPSLVIDRARLKQNIATLLKHINGRFHFRIVAKSLPSINLLKEVMEQASSNRLMLFHQPFANQVAAAFPESDVLFGKPMPVAAAKNFYRQLQGEFNPDVQLQWLIDSPERLKQYSALAERLGRKMRINIEIDVGLHRGGVSNTDDLLEMLALIKNSALLSFSGLMGYEPHVVKLPGDVLSHRDKAMTEYQKYLDVAVQFFGALDSSWTLNAAGSPTYQLYDEGEFPHNELAAGSCLVKPTDFDMPSLADHVAASFIATPVIKALPNTELPGVAALGKLMAWWNPNRERSFFTYGGYWKAKTESPAGLSTNPVFGRSTNQEMLNGSRSVELAADDWVFLRPTQSEFVFLQFGDIAVMENGELSERWPVFQQQV